MAWIWKQSTGQLFAAGSPLVTAVGYSGFGDGKNNPDMQNVPDVGPIPEGLYEIGPPADTASHGPYVMSLTPDHENEMFDRSGFLVHGDSIENPGAASKGCIILAHPVRMAIWGSEDHSLQVIA